MQRPLKLKRKQTVRRGVSPCQAFYLDPSALVNHELRTIQSLASEELVLESNLHASSLTVVQCVAAFGLPRQAPTLTPQFALSSASASGASFALLTSVTEDHALTDREADLAACLATPATAENEESQQNRRPVIRASEGIAEQEALQNQQDAEYLMEEAPSSGLQLRSLFKGRNLRRAEAILALLPACPITGRKLSESFSTAQA